MRAEFAVVAVVEELPLSLRVLEARLPHLFAGISERYQNQEVRARRNPRASAVPSTEVAAAVEALPIVRLEYRLYHFAHARLQELAFLCGDLRH